MIFRQIKPLSPASRRPARVARVALLALALSIPAITVAQPGDAPSLTQFLAKKREALLALDGRETVQQISAHVTAESRSGVRRLRIRDHQYLSDSDRSYAGYNLGPGSWDTGVAVLASAVADAFVTEAARANIPIDAIDVIFTSHPDAPEVERTHPVSYPRNLTYVAHIASPASAAQLDALRIAVDRASPVLSLIRDAQAIGHGNVRYTLSTAHDPNAPPGLRDFLVEKRAAILRRAAAARQNPRANPYALRAHSRVEPTTGIRTTRTGAGNFQILHDGALEKRGYDLAPSAEEHMLGVMGTCLTHIYEVQAAVRGVILDSLELRVDGELVPATGGNPARYRNIGYTVAISSPDSAAAIDQLRVAVEQRCPVYNLIKAPQQIRGSVVKGVYRPPT